MNKKVVLGFSGGVDSTAAAVLLKRKGYEVTALYFDVLQNSSEQARKRSEEVSELLGLDFVYKNVSKDFERLILSQFKDEYRCGHTPIPCLFCNPLIKFKVLMDYAEEIGADHIATGHYANISFANDCYFVTHAKNLRKDQSYMLGRLNQDILKRVIFPLGEFIDKEEIRNLVKDYKLPNFADKDSQDICFIPDGNYRSYLLDNGFKDKEGLFKDKDGNILGRHNGSFNFTIGQRKGLGIAIGKPAFVTRIDSENNVVYIGDDEELYKTTVYVNSMFFSDCGSCKELPEKYNNILLKCKLRYAAKEAECSVTSCPSGAQLSFDIPQRAPTPGQAAVFYDGDRVVGSAIIL